MQGVRVPVMSFYDSDGVLSDSHLNAPDSPHAQTKVNVVSFRQKFVLDYSRERDDNLCVVARVGMQDVEGLQQCAQVPL